MAKAKAQENEPPKIRRSESGEADINSLADLLEWFLMYDERTARMRHANTEELFQWKQMDDVVNRFARELADAIAAAVAENPQVEACREKARAAGFEMKVTLEAVVGFVSRSQSAALAKVTAPARVVQPKRNLEVTANDRRFLRSLRIAADETTESVE